MIGKNSIKPISVSQLNNYIDILLRGNSTLSNLKIIGEITGFKNHSSGHKYFSIKDESAFLRFEPDDGMSVEISVLSAYISQMEPIQYL